MAEYTILWSTEGALDPDDIIDGGATAPAVAEASEDHQDVPAEPTDEQADTGLIDLIQSIVEEPEPTAGRSAMPRRVTNRATKAGTSRSKRPPSDIRAAKRVEDPANRRITQAIREEAPARAAKPVAAEVRAKPERTPSQPLRMASVAIASLAAVISMSFLFQSGGQGSGLAAVTLDTGSLARPFVPRWHDGDIDAATHMAAPPHEVATVSLRDGVRGTPAGMTQPGANQDHTKAIRDLPAPASVGAVAEVTLPVATPLPDSSAGGTLVAILPKARWSHQDVAVSPLPAAKLLPLLIGEPGANRDVINGLSNRTAPAAISQVPDVVVAENTVPVEPVETRPAAPAADWEEDFMNDLTARAVSALHRDLNTR